jgi:hypothetical protein
MRSWLMALAVPLIVAHPGFCAVSLDATSATVSASGDRADLCVVLDSGGAQVAGTQNDLTWDGTCATLATPADCRVNSATGKTLSGALAPMGSDFSYRGLVLSFTDTEPLPDGQLYCCTFTVESAPGSCCPVAVVNAAASDPSGGALFVSAGQPASLCVAVAGAPTPTPTPQADPAQSSGGCQAAQASPSGLAVSLGVIAVLRALRRRRG